MPEDSEQLEETIESKVIRSSTQRNSNQKRNHIRDSSEDNLRSLESDFGSESHSPEKILFSNKREEEPNESEWHSIKQEVLFEEKSRKSKNMDWGFRERK